MSVWEEQHVLEAVLEVLGSVPVGNPHQFGRPYISAYQLAFEVEGSHPEIRQALGDDYPIGGRGSGQHYSLAQYVAGQLSQRIGDDSDFPVQGAFLSNAGIEDLSFRAPDGSVHHSSLTDTDFDLSLYRLAPH